jgi:hypothetical protein
MKRKAISILILFTLVLTALAIIPSNVSAVDEADIEASIVLGLNWLASQQQADGRWWFFDYDYDERDFGTTALVLLKFVDRAKELGKDPFEIDDADPDYYEYATNVIDGYDFIFSYLDEDMTGVHTEYFLDVYNTACAMMAIATTNTPSRNVITNGGVSDVEGWTYQEVLQGMMDFMADAQNDDTDTYDCDVGGWGYYANYDGWSDNSNTGYASLGMGFAAAAAPYGFGLTIPTEVLDKLDVFIDNIQDANGGSWYEICDPWPMINILKTGNLLYEMWLVGDDISDARVQAAIDYIENHWTDTGSNPDYSSASLGWMDSYQAMFTMMKGLVTFGINTLDVGGPIDWFDEVATAIIANQNPAGYFEWINTALGEGEQSTVLRTAWALLTLEKFIPPSQELTVEKDFRYTNVNWYRHLIFSEYFSSCGSDWTEDPDHEDNWYCSVTSFAGGAPNEYVFYWDVLPFFTDHTWFMSPAINTVGMSAVEMSYKQKVVHWANSFFLGVEASPDGTNWYTAFSQEYSDDSGPETITFMLPDEAINSPTTYVRFFFDGYSDDITYWDIDDVEIYANSNLGGLLPTTIYLGLQSEDFEADDGGFTATGSWEWGVPTDTYGPAAHSGTKLWGTNLAGDHPDNDNAKLETLPVTLGSSAVLEFWMWYNCENYYDGMNIKISTDGGITWSILGSYLDPYNEDAASNGPTYINAGIPGEPCFSGYQGSWEHITFDLSAYEGETVIIRFHFGSDQSLTNPGFFIDDLTIYPYYEYYDVDVVVDKKGMVKSTNPGQLYGVISITGPVSEVAIMDTFDDQFDVNPAKLGGGVEIIMVDPDGYATILTDEPGISADVDNDANEVEISINLIEATGDSLPAGWTLMVYIKFQTAMKHKPWTDFNEYFVNTAEVNIDETTFFTVGAQIYLTEK